MRSLAILSLLFLSFIYLPALAQEQQVVVNLHRLVEALADAVDGHALEHCFDAL